MRFKKGDYVVLLSTCNGDEYCWDPSMNINHCYRLTRDFNHDHTGFFIEKDIEQNKPNGWSCGLKNFNKNLNKTRFRHATKYEIEKYKKLNRPFKINERKNKLIALYSLNEKGINKFNL